MFFSKPRIRLRVLSMQHEFSCVNNGLWTEPLIIYSFLHNFLGHITALLLRMFIFTAFTSTNCTRVSHKTNTTACSNSTVSPKLSRVSSSSRWTWAVEPLALHSWSETTPTDKMAFQVFRCAFFKTKILPACQECCSCCLCKVCSSLGQKSGNERAITGRKIVLTCPLEA